MGQFDDDPFMEALESVDRITQDLPRIPNGRIPSGLRSVPASARKVTEASSSILGSELGKWPMQRTGASRSAYSNHRQTSCNRKSRTSTRFRGQSRADCRKSTLL